MVGSVDFQSFACLPVRAQITGPPHEASLFLDASLDVPLQAGWAPPRRPGCCVRLCHPASASVFWAPFRDCVGCHSLGV